MTLRIGTMLLLAVMSGPLAAVSSAQDSVRARYERAQAHERAVRAAEAPALADLRAAAREYEAVVARFPASAYCDNALMQAASLELTAFDLYGLDVDQRAGRRLLTRIREQYPSSSLIARANELLAASPANAPDPAAAAPAAPIATPPAKPEPATPAPAGTTGTTNAIREIKRTSLPDGVRVSIQLDAESTYYAERLDNPRRVFFDLKGSRPVAPLLDATLKFPDAVVREIRLGRHPQNTTRIVMDMEGVDSYSVFTLYNPFRLVIDFKASGVTTQALADTPLVPIVVPLQPAVTPAVAALTVAAEAPGTSSKPGASRAVAPGTRTPPALPSANADGQFSLARQLGLGVSRIVIDAGHGGHDPGAQANGINESELVLDVAQRLSRLVQKQTAIEVVMTRDSDVFIPLEERTAIANREGADLFLSIHANASRNSSARGIESYFLNFASNPEAEAVAARENSASGQTMHNLPDIVKAIALNNKIDESRDFADMVQRSMVKRLSPRNKLLRDLGVKQAPFVVLIGAGMPSVLAEISFVTNRQEGLLLKTQVYREQIAEALLDAILRYQQSLKKMKSSTGAQIGAR